MDFQLLCKLGILASICCVIVDSLFLRHSVLTHTMGVRTLCSHVYSHSLIEFPSLSQVPEGRSSKNSNRSYPGTLLLQIQLFARALPSCSCPSLTLSETPPSVTESSFCCVTVRDVSQPRRSAPSSQLVPSLVPQNRGCRIMSCCH